MSESGREASSLGVKGFTYFFVIAFAPVRNRVRALIFIFQFHDPDHYELLTTSS